jgi:uracil-DNA glycosylase family 4
MKTPIELFQEHTLTYGLEIECPMHGPRTAEIAIVGEYPGQNEVINQRPFSGGSGKVLWDALRPYNILQTEVYKTNVLKRQVGPRNKPDKHELNLWKEALEVELSNLPNLKYIFALGNTAIDALLGFDKITKYRGSVYDYKDKTVVVANNPAMVLRNPSTGIVFKMDAKKFVDVINGDYKPHYVRKIIIDTFEAALEYIKSLRGKRFAFDIETINWATACYGFATSAHEGVCIPFRNDTENLYTPEQELQLQQTLADVSEDKDTLIIAQNGNFDGYFLGVKDAVPIRVGFDTLLGHHTLYPQLPHNLGFLTSQYTNHPYYKDEIDEYKEGGDIITFWNYNATDAAITFACAEEIEKELKEQNLYNFFMDHVMKVLPHLTYSTTCGVKIDTSVKEKLKAELQIELDKFHKEFQEKVRDALVDPEAEVNPNSPKQLCALVFDELGAKHRRRSVDKAVREDLLKDNRTSMAIKSVLVALDRYTATHKFFSTYVATEIDDDDRYRAEFKQFGVAKAPGRLSSSKVLWGTGGNLQNQPAQAFQMFVPDEGTVGVYFDLAQAEARVVGWRAGIEQWIQDFERARLEGGFDAHRSLAATMFNMDYELVPEKDIDENGNFTIRFVAKRCRHGLNYRMQPARLAATTGMHYTTAIRNYNVYHNVNPELRKWWAFEERSVRKSRMQFNAYGRRNIFLDRIDGDDALESIIAFYPQSTIGDKTQRVWRQCHDDPRWDIRKARIAINVHDALYGFATPDYAMTALQMMKQYAEEPIMIENIFTKEISPMIVPADCKMTVPDEHGVHRLSNLKEVEVEI